jgi:hypothetical protein
VKGGSLLPHSKGFASFDKNYVALGPLSMRTPTASRQSVGAFIFSPVR